jgi:hypothetical protein
VQKLSRALNSTFFYGAIAGQRTVPHFSAIHIPGTGAVHLPDLEPVTPAL